MILGPGELLRDVAGILGTVHEVGLLDCEHGHERVVRLDLAFSAGISVRDVAAAINSGRTLPLGATGLG